MWEKKEWQHKKCQFSRLRDPEFVETQYVSLIEKKTASIPMNLIFSREMYRVSIDTSQFKFYQFVVANQFYPCPSNSTPCNPYAHSKAYDPSLTCHKWHIMWNVVRLQFDSCMAPNIDFVYYISMLFLVVLAQAGRQANSHSGEQSALFQCMRKRNSIECNWISNWIG